MKNKGYLYVKAMSDLGSRMDMIVLGTLIYAATKSAAWLAASLAAGVIGGLLSGMISGVVADRFDRKKIMIVTDWLRFGLILLLIPFPQPEMILLVRFVMGIVGSFFEVSYNAEIPNIYGKDNLVATNAMSSRLGAISMVFGFLGGGLVQQALGYESVLLMDSATFVISAIFLLRMKWNHTSARESGAQTRMNRSVLQSLKSQWEDIKEVKGYLSTKTILLIVFMLYLLDTFGAGSHNLGAPLLAAELDEDRQALYYGLIWSVWGAGNVLTTLLLPKIKWFGRNLGLVYLLSTPFMSLGFIAIFATVQLPWILTAAFVTGLFDAIAMTAVMVLFQQTENHIRGRIFGVSTVLNRFGFGIGFIVAPLALERLSLFQMVLVFHGIVIVSALVALVFYKMAKSRGLSVGAAQEGAGV
ncbi:MFS transporter [Cohnella pontilimi]|uniref:MFS transporter n=1 Tax=Cohnella pontilimi TaxID=2564100 RepID=A0A4U0FAY8_9BACL|nr:MFS transporter [Cohnella pontilimi]TJY41831.1 MFS transporter [Cohnella pontilimi]